MIQFCVKKPDDGGYIYFFGISEGNIDRLKQGKPLAKGFTALNPDSKDELVLFYGRTEDEMLKVLEDAGIEIGRFEDARGDGKEGAPAGASEGEPGGPSSDI